MLRVVVGPVCQLQRDIGARPRGARGVGAIIVLLLLPLAAWGDSNELTAIDRLTIIVPGFPGGGWDQTARAMRQVILEAGIARAVDVTNTPGAGGVVGLAQFLDSHRGDEKVLLVSGLSMLGSIRANGAALSLAQATPIARLTGDYPVVVVPAASPFKTLDGLLQAFQANSGAISWAAGDHGSTDHLLVALVAQALEIPSTQVNYFPSPGAGEEMKALLAGDVSAGVIGHGEAVEHVRSGKLRVLAISSQNRLPGLEVPTLKEKGIDVSLVNWRGVFAAPGIRPEQRERLKGLVKALVHQEAWRSALEAHRWIDMYLEGDEFARFVLSEQARLESGTNLRVSAGGRTQGRRQTRSSTLTVAVLLLVGAVGVVTALWRRQWSAGRRRGEEDVKRRGDVAQGLFSRSRDEIERQFQTWGLTLAECEVAMLLLKGLRHREIAQIRNTTERTVRHQALAIYKKAGIEGRADLAAHFLEDLLVHTPKSRSGVA